MRVDTTATTMASRGIWAKVLVILSWLIALVSFDLPLEQSLIDYGGALHFSLPLSLLWLAMLWIAFRRQGKTWLWMLPGAVPGLYWAVTILVHGIPECYWMGNCI